MRGKHSKKRASKALWSLSEEKNRLVTAGFCVPEISLGFCLDSLWVAPEKKVTPQNESCQIMKVAPEIKRLKKPGSNEPDFFSHDNSTENDSFNRQMMDLRNQ